MLRRNGSLCVMLLASALGIHVPGSRADDAYRAEVEAFASGAWPS